MQQHPATTIVPVSANADTHLVFIFCSPFGIEKFNASHFRRKRARGQANY
jgi:hypothetical protein